jgi:hypothetical protein
MGEVYRTPDTKLKREVAIKILPDEFSRDTDRVHRFQRSVMRGCVPEGAISPAPSSRTMGHSLERLRPAAQIIEAE